MGNEVSYQKILESGARKIAVIAGPGSGKTKQIIIPKASSILADPKVANDEILLLSFSRPSALDLKQRIGKISTTGKNPKTSTLHGFCLAYLLHENSHEMRKRVESIVLDFEKRHIINDLKTKFPAMDKRDLKKLLKEFSAAWAVNSFEEIFVEPEEKLRFKSALMNWLIEHEAAMMEEIVYQAVKLAKSSTSEFIDKPKYIFVDEYQDLNKVEQEFVQLLANNSELLLIVGDPDQSIYSFKFAHPSGIQQFKQMDEVESHALEYTGRCSKKVVDLANKVLIQIDPTRTNLLKPLPDKEDGQVTFRGFDFLNQEFEYVFNEVDSLIKSGVLPEDILILTPKKKLSTDFVEYVLNKDLKLSYGFDVANRQEFTVSEQEKILLFGLLVNQKSILHIRSFIGITDDHSFSSEIELLKQRYGSLLEAYNTASLSDFPKAKPRIKKVVENLIRLKSMVAQLTGDGVVLDQVLNELFPRDDEHLIKIRDLLEKLREDDDSVTTLYQKFLDYLRTQEVLAGKVKIMTLLGSKGLDAEYVFIIGCNNGNIPGKNRSDYLSDSQFIDEQKRLLYVGITRAKRALTITWERYLPFELAKQQGIAYAQARTISGKRYVTVNLCDFLQ